VAVTHDLKVVPPYFEPLENGSKPYEVRRDDRPDGFAVGDVLVLREWQPVAGYFDPDAPQGHPGRYTGREVTRTVTHVLKGHEAEAFGLQPGYVVLGLSDPGQSPVRVQPGRLMAGGQSVVQAPPGWRSR
jgi:hypothetical protein